MKVLICILLLLGSSLALAQSHNIQHTVLITDNNQMPPKAISQDSEVRIISLNSHRGLPKTFKDRPDTQCILKVEVRANGKVSWVTIVSAIENQFSGYASEVAFDWRFEPTTRPFTTHITVMYKGTERPLVRRK